MINFADCRRVGEYLRFTRFGGRRSHKRQLLSLLEKNTFHIFTHLKMSTRYMKKVYGSDVILEKDNDDASDVEVSVSSNAKTKSFNVFDVVRRNLYRHCHFISFWVRVMLMVSCAHS